MDGFNVFNIVLYYVIFLLITCNFVSKLSLMPIQPLNRGRERERGCKVCLTVTYLCLFFSHWWHGGPNALPSSLMSSCLFHGQPHYGTHTRLHSSAVWALNSLTPGQYKHIGLAGSLETTSDQTSIVVIYPLCSYTPPTIDQQKNFPSICPSLL